MFSWTFQINKNCKIYLTDYNLTTCNGIKICLYSTLHMFFLYFTVPNMEKKISFIPWVINYYLAHFFNNVNITIDSKGSEKNVKQMYICSIMCCHMKIWKNLPHSCVGCFLLKDEYPISISCQCINNYPLETVDTPVYSFERH